MTVFYACFALLVLVSALWVVLLRNLFRAALSLGLVLLGIAALFLLLEAEFLAFVQILIYVGAILTLVVFAIMLTAKLHGSTAAQASSGGRIAEAGVNRSPVLPAIVSLGLFAVLARATLAIQWPASSTEQAVSLALLGQRLVKELVLPFELVSLVFVAALVGAIALAAGPRPPGPAG